MTESNQVEDLEPTTSVNALVRLVSVLCSEVEGTPKGEDLKSIVTSVFEEHSINEVIEAEIKINRPSI